jgi:hypothetical protein
MNSSFLYYYIVCWLESKRTEVRPIRDMSLPHAEFSRRISDFSI